MKTIRYWVLHLRSGKVIECQSEDIALEELNWKCRCFDTGGLWVVVQETQDEYEIERGLWIPDGVGKPLHVSAHTLENTVERVNHLLNGCWCQYAY